MGLSMRFFKLEDVLRGRATNYFNLNVDSDRDYLEAILRNNKRAVLLDITNEEYGGGSKCPSYFTIPGSYSGNPVVAVYGSVSYHKDDGETDWIDGNPYIYELTIPEGVEIIGWELCKGCTNLERIRLPKSLKVIASEDFCDCERLKDVSLPDSLERFYGCYNFKGCRNITDITIPSGVSSISMGCFWSTGLKKVSIPANVRSIEEYAFYSCSKLESVTIAEGVREIKEYAFGNNPKLKRIVFPKSLSNISDRVFACDEGKRANTKPTILCYKGTDGYFFANEKHLPFETIE